MSAELIDLQRRQRIALVAERLGRDLVNAQAAIDHHGGDMPETDFTLALINSVAGFLGDRFVPGAMTQDEFIALMGDLLQGELVKHLVRSRGPRIAPREQR